MSLHPVLSALGLSENESGTYLGNGEWSKTSDAGVLEPVNPTTGDVLGKLYGMFGNQNLSFSELSKINDQIEKENALREKSFALQQKLIEATIQEIELRTKAFANGDALIKIDGAGLQPHLEAFMWEILRTIQTRVNADGLKLLLGT